MAVGIANYPNITAASADYPNGYIKNDPSGTPVNVLTNGDVQIFFDKLLRIAGITANGLPDNETNGYQLIDALIKAARPYDVITGTLTQAGSADPTATIAENSLSALPVFTRALQGIYSVTLAGEFTPAASVICFASSKTQDRSVRIARDSNDLVSISSVDIAGAFDDDVILDFEIRVYR
jgi:hypothetical protein